MTFTSARHGYSFRHPAAWTIHAATTPWVFGDPVDHNLPGDPATDWMQIQGQGSGNLTQEAGTFWFASTAIPAATGEDGWLLDFADGSDPTCWPLVAAMPTVPIGITTGHYHGGTSCGFLDAMTTQGGRGYTFASTNTRDLALFKTVLSTVVLDPASADDTPVATPMPSATEPSLSPPPS